MSNIAIVGLQWGDEGKGKVVDLLAANAHVIARFQGGANAGHTIIVGDKKYVLHLIPSGILHPDKICVIGNGVVLDPFTFVEELRALGNQGVIADGRLFVSSACNLVLPYHKLLDEMSESERGGSSIGTTLRGIGPAYRDKVARVGIRLVDIYNSRVLREKLDYHATELQRHLGTIKDDPRANFGFMLEQLEALRPTFAPMMVDVSKKLNDFQREGKCILFEGAQGAMLDVDLGTYPYTTSSNTTVGGALTGLGVGPRLIDEVVGIVKAYSTRVGGGPFPTELTDEIGSRLREVGGEYGSTTGRPRRTGWIDLVALRHACRINGVDKIAVTKLDVLDGMTELRVCVSYELDGKTLNEIPLDPSHLERVRPVYREFPGWSGETTSQGRFDALPREAQRYVRFIADELGVGIKLVSTGAARTDTILV